MAYGFVTTNARARINAFVVNASFITWAIGVDNALRMTTASCG